MSNLIKSVYLNVHTEDTRVIDSEVQLKELLPEVYSRSGQSDSNMGAFHRLSLENVSMGESEELAEKENGSSPIIKMEDVLEEERRKLSEESKEEIEQMLAEARNQADQIVISAKEEADNISKQAYSEGYEEGVKQGQIKGEALLMEKEEQLQNEFQQKMQALQKEEENLEPHFAELTCSLLHKITGMLFEDKKEVITYLIHQSIMGLERTSHINIRVSKEDMVEVSAKRKEWKEQLSYDVEVEVTEDASLKQGECIIETDDRIIDCSLGVQLENLCDQIRLLSLSE